MKSLRRRQLDGESLIFKGATVVTKQQAANAGGNTMTWLVTQEKNGGKLVVRELPGASAPAGAGEDAASPVAGTPPVTASRRTTRAMLAASGAEVVVAPAAAADGNGAGAEPSVASVIVDDSSSEGSVDYGLSQEYAYMKEIMDDDGSDEDEE
jgi:hypothetical protein